MQPREISAVNNPSLDHGSTDKARPYGPEVGSPGQEDIAAVVRGHDVHAHDSIDSSICQLITGLTRNELAALRAKLGAGETTLRVGNLLPEAIDISMSQHGEKLAAAMAPVVGPAVFRQVEQDPVRFGEAIAPALGPAIKQAVVKAVRSAVSGFEAAVEHSVSPRSIKWRAEALVSGKSFGEIVLLKTLLYRVEHAFLSEAQTGLLICHQQQTDSSDNNPDLVSGLITAIRQCANEAFSANSDGGTQRFEIGDFTLCICNAADLQLAVAIRGTAPTDIDAVFFQTLHRMQLRYRQNESTIPPDIAESELADLLALKQSVTKKKSSLPRWLMLAAFVCVAAYGSYQWIAARRARAERDRSWNSLVTTLRQEPGIKVTAVDTTATPHIIYGLRDPSARDPLDLARATWDDNVTFKLEPYLSMSPAVIQRRATEILVPPPGVTLSVSGDTLVVHGTASQTWIDSVVSRISRGRLIGISSFDMTDCTPVFTQDRT